MDSLLQELERRFDRKISVSLVHYPLSSHPHALPAASAFECARKQHRAAEMTRTLFASQAEFGNTPWLQLGQRSGVSDTTAFVACMNSDPARDLVRAGTELANRLQVTGTPTVVVDGWLFKPSSPSTIETAVTAAVQGRSPKP
jgi:protein-disulfide isomerase